MACGSGRGQGWRRWLSGAGAVPAVGAMDAGVEDGAFGGLDEHERRALRQRLPSGGGVTGSGRRAELRGGSSCPGEAGFEGP